MEIFLITHFSIGLICGITGIIFEVKEAKQHPERYEENPLLLWHLIMTLVVCIGLGVVIPIAVLFNLKIK